MPTPITIHSPVLTETGWFGRRLLIFLVRGLSFYDFVKAPGWGSGAIFVYDLGAVFVPFVPGSVTGRIVAKVASDKVILFKDSNHQRQI